MVSFIWLFSIRRRSSGLREFDIMQCESTIVTLCSYRIREGIKDTLHKKWQISNCQLQRPRLFQNHIISVFRKYVVVVFSAHERIYYKVLCQKEDYYIRAEFWVRTQLIICREKNLPNYFFFGWMLNIFSHMLPITRLNWVIF